jgi:hypothetical protein
MTSWQAEVLSVGTWNGDTFTRTDLAEIAANFARLKEHVRVPLKFGHADGQTLLGQPDGDPALGWVTALEARGDRLVATFGHVPALVRHAVAAHLYRHVSSEIAYQVTYHGERIGKVLVGVALLGADLPAVSNLADLGAYLSARGLTHLRVYRFARAQPAADQQGNSMTRHATPPALTGSPPGNSTAAPPAASPVPSATVGESADVLRLSAELAARQVDIERLSRGEAQARSALRGLRFRAERAAFAAALDGWVRVGALPPVARDRALAAVDGQERTFGLALAAESEPGRSDGIGTDGAGRDLAGDSLGERAEFVFGAGLVRELMEAMAQPRPFGREAATAAPLGELARQAAHPAADTLAREASKLAAGGRYTLAQAQAHVLSQDADLAARWLAEVNHTLPTGGQ